MPFTIACDVDDVILPFIGAWLARYNADYGESMTPEDVTEWEIAKCVHPSCGRDIYRYLLDPTLYDAIQPYDGALTGIAHLREAGHRILFVTAANLYTAGRKYRYLQEHGFLAAEPVSSLDYIEAHDKTLINADLLIDDRLETVAAWVQSGRPAILVDRPHNHHVDRARIADPTRMGRATSWPEIVGLVEAFHDAARDGHAIGRRQPLQQILDAIDQSDVLPAPPALETG